MGRKEGKSSIALSDASDEAPKAKKANSEAAETLRQKARASVGERKMLDTQAAAIKALHAEIIERQKKSTADAATIGERLQRVKRIFNDVNVGMSFRKWHLTRCGLSDGTVHNYTRLAEAVAKDPSLKALGLTEAYYTIGLKKHQVLGRPAEAKQTSTQDEGEEEVEVPQKTERKIGSYEVFREKGIYVVELNDDWQQVIAEIATDPKQIADMLSDGGLLLRVLPPNPQFTNLTTALVNTEAVGA